MDILTKIEQLLDQTKLKEAEKEITKILVDNLSSPQYYFYSFLLAKLNFELERDDQVMPNLEKILQSSEKWNFIDKVYLLAANYFFIIANREQPTPNKYQLIRKAEKYYKAIDRSNLSRANLAIYFYERARIEEYLGHIRNSIHFFKSALPMYSTHEDQKALHEYIAEAYKNIKEYKQAAKHYDCAIKLTPTSKPKTIAYLQIEKARILEYSGNWKEANLILMNLLETFDMNESTKDFEISMYCYDILGYSFSSLKEYSKSLHYFEKALDYAKKTKNSITPYIYEISRIERKLGNYENARNKAMEALETSNSDTYTQLIYIELYRQYFDLGEYDQALNSLQLLLKTYPNYEELGWVYLKIGLVYTLKGEYIEAINFLKKAQKSMNEKDENYSTTQYLIAFCFLKRGDIDNAALTCKKIIKNHAQNSSIAWAHAILARCYYEKGLRIDAKTEAEKAKEYVQPNTELYRFVEEILIDILRDLGIN
ncbi:tetratricopeptide repeat protein [Candidatus Peregrinibacteria bacterium]|nr:tetratricopeptide repeat protein [Candidatus Peregrinibacteria bacterium]